MQGFAGVDYSTKDRSSGPVQFERDPAEAVEADPFGLDQIISEVSCNPILADKFKRLLSLTSIMSVSRQAVSQKE